MVETRGLWPTLRNAIGYTDSGHCMLWTIVAHAVLSRLSDAPVFAYSAQIHSQPHLFLKSRVPEGNLISLNGMELETFLRRERANLPLVSIPRTSGYRLQGYVWGEGGDIAILDGVADQQELEASSRATQGGFYGSLAFAPEGLKEFYLQGGQRDPVAPFVVDCR